MNPEEKLIIKSLNKIGVDTRFITLYKNKIYINNLKFSKFSRKKEEDFKENFPQIEVIRSKLFQKICIKVSRTVKNQIKPRTKLYIEKDNSLENILLYLVLEPYKRKYGVKIEDNKSEDILTVSSYSMDDFCLKYLDLMINGEKIENKLDENTIYPLKHVKYEWIYDWMQDSGLSFLSNKTLKQNTDTQIINFLEEHIPNVQESIIQSVTYLENNQNRGK